MFIQHAHIFTGEETTNNPTTETAPTILQHAHVFIEDGPCKIPDTTSDTSLISGENISNTFTIPTPTAEPREYYTTRMKDIVFFFKQKYYITALVTDNFNVSKTAKRLTTTRGDIYNHIGCSNKEHVKLAKEYGLLE